MALAVSPTKQGVLGMTLTMRVSSPAASCAHKMQWLQGETPHTNDTCPALVQIQPLLRDGCRQREHLEGTEGLASRDGNDGVLVCQV